MLTDIKQQMINSPEQLAEVLEYFGFAHIQLGNNEIRFARNEDGNKNIRICLHDNQYINVQDFARDVHLDVISYIMHEKEMTFREVLDGIKVVLHITDFGEFKRPHKREIFGGVYSSVKKKTAEEMHIYPESIMEQYDEGLSVRFLNDHISLKVQRKFGVRYDHESERVVFPVRNEFGEIVGVKGRWNGEPSEDRPKYLYLLPVSSAKILYGYSENYANLVNGDVLVCEAEKAVMQAASYGYKNCVSLGGHNLSETHAKLICQLNPKRVIIAMDEGLDFEYTKRNAETLKAFCRMQAPEILVWDAAKSNVKEKASLTDNGKQKFYSILKNELVRISV